MNNDVPVALKNGALPELAGRITTPLYDRSKTKPRILHLGVGGFHRAHMACYTHRLLQEAKSDWAINGVGLTKHDKKMAETMEAQDGLYTLIARGADSEDAAVIGSITDYFFSPGGSGELCDRAAKEDYRIVSLTVTENGYHYKGDNRDLDFEDPSIARDLKNPEDPESAIGMIFRIAQLRLGAGKKLPTFLSCDNLPHNGATLRKLVLQYGREVDPETTTVLEKEGRFPNCMVDRITPGTTDKERDYVAKTWGIEDRWPVVCEDFIQWFIEDDFSDGRPPWEEVGAAMVPDVTPYELMKIRLLNGSHSALSYISYLLGYRHVDDAMADAEVRSFVSRYMREIEPAVGEVPGVDLRQYQEKLVERFSNPAIRDQVLRLCEDGSRKIPNMMLEPMAELLSEGSSVGHGAFAIAAWIRFLQGVDENGESIPIKDPNSERLQAAAKQCEEDVSPFIGLDFVFPARLRQNSQFSREVLTWFLSLKHEGARQTIRAFLDKA